MNQDNSQHVFEFDEEDDDWIPLSPPHRSYANQESNTNTNAADSNYNSGTSSGTSTQYSTANIDTKPTSSSTSASAKPNPEATNEFDGDMERIRHHHERNSSLKQHLINQPIARFPFYFLKNLASEVWASHYYIRLGKFINCMILFA